MYFARKDSERRCANPNSPSEISEISDLGLPELRSVKQRRPGGAMSSQRSSKGDYDATVSKAVSELGAWLVEASERPETYCSLANIFAAGNTKLFNPTSNQKAIEAIFSRLSLILCEGRDDCDIIWALAGRLSEKRMLLMQARLWSTEKLPGQNPSFSESRASSVSVHSIRPSFTQFQTESYTASRPSLSSLEPDENRVDSNRTSATPYSFGSRAEKVRWKKYRRVYRRVHAQIPKDVQKETSGVRIEKQNKSMNAKSRGEKKRKGRLSTLRPPLQIYYIFPKLLGGHAHGLKLRVRGHRRLN